MPVHPDLSDEYVAQLLKKDAKNLESRFSRVGNHDLFLKRPTINAPKPNTRFLKNIIKETDSHNAALRAKETQESQARLRILNRGVQAKDGESTPGDGGRLQKRRRLDRSCSRDRNIERHRLPKSSRQEKYKRERSASPSEKGKHGHIQRDEKSRSQHANKRQYRDRSVEELYRKSRYRRDAKYSQHSSSRTDMQPKDRRSTDKDRKPRSIRPRKDHPEIGPRQYPDHPSRVHSPRTQREHDDVPEYTEVHERSSSDESDPLQDLVGPAPPPAKPQVRARGRGALNTTSHSAIDSHFAQNYDPADDAHPEPDVETDDWDQALEALRDRQKWQQRGAERLRAAGFSEEEVAKWTKGSINDAAVEKDDADVRWKGRGESREWDHGKIATADGISTQAEWGRLR